MSSSFNLSLRSFSFHACLLLPEGEQALPPGQAITKTLYHKNMFTLPAAPGLVLLVIVRLGTAATRAGSSYLVCGLFINIFPVSVIPPGTNRHDKPPVKPETRLAPLFGLQSYLRTPCTLIATYAAR